MPAIDQELADTIRIFVSDVRVILHKRDAETRREIAALKSDLARMTAKLQGVKDQVADISDTIPNVDEIAARGSAHRAVNEDIRESMARMEGSIENATPIKASRGLSMLLNALRQNERAEA